MKKSIVFILKPVALMLGYAILWASVIAAVCYPKFWVIATSLVVVFLSAAGLAKLYPQGL